MEYGIKLEVFEGPLDLLLYLIQKNNLDIYDIPIAKITSEYLLYLDMMKNLNLEVAGDFLVMAATLMKMKSKMLLPSHGEEEQDEDPRKELVRSLVEYKKYKEASKILRNNLETQKDIFYRNTSPEFADEDFGIEVTIFNLLDAFKVVIERSKKIPKEIIKEECTVEEKMKLIIRQLEGRQFISFFSIFESDETKRAIIVTFLALLELIKRGLAAARQDKNFGDIRIYGSKTIKI
ncbi:MAG: Segregation and condensation protein A [Elusimicrobia bacterium ADurb.Bin231]|nr:MAG: Segregation and condensation protein A [Elusimicrobia bacterium ADurb.Bin231]